MAIRIEDQKVVVTKFIKKNKIHSGQWAKRSTNSEKSLRGNNKNDSKNVTYMPEKAIPSKLVLIKDTCLPEEIDLLLKLDHPNIIKVLDVHENEHYFQMIMEHHGQMDLFEFIELRHRLVRLELG